MPSTLPYVSEFLRVLHSTESAKSDQYFNSVNVVPSLDFLGPDGGAGLIPVMETDNDSEVFVTKKVYLAIFKECHDFFNEFLASFSLSGKTDYLQLLNSSEQDYLDTLYYATVGLLFTTSDNHTNLLLHSTLIDNGLVDTKFESCIIESMLNCNVSRINKSSLLWEQLKKQVCSGVLRAKSVKNPQRLFRLVIASHDKHPRSYYCWNFLSWLFDLIASLSQKIESFELFESLKMHCRKNISNSSGWWALLNYLAPRTESIVFTQFQFNHKYGPFKFIAANELSIAKTSLINQELEYCLQCVVDLKISNKSLITYFAKLLQIQPDPRIIDVLKANVTQFELRYNTELHFSESMWISGLSDGADGADANCADNLLYQTDLGLAKVLKKLIFFIDH